MNGTSGSKFETVLKPGPLYEGSASVDGNWSWEQRGSPARRWWVLVGFVLCDALSAPRVTTATRTRTTFIFSSSSI